MQLKHLEYLIVLAKERNFGRAARALKISQPALSQAIRQIETHFSGSIVMRQQSGFQGFTPEGEAVLNWARQTLADHDRLLGATRQAETSQLRGSLTIGLSPVAMSITSMLTAPFAEEHPLVRISVRCSNLPEIERGIREFGLDIGVTYLEGVTQTGLRTFALYDEAYYLLVPNGHFLEDRESIDWKEAGDLPLCLLSPNLHNRIIIDSIFEQVGARPTAVIETNCSLGLFAHMRTGKWLTIVPHSYFYLLGDWAFIRSIPIVNPDVQKAIGLLIRDRDPVSPVVSAFVETARKARIDLQLNRYKRTASS